MKGGHTRAAAAANRQAAAATATVMELERTVQQATKLLREGKQARMGSAVAIMRTLAAAKTQTSRATDVDDDIAQLGRDLLTCDNNGAMDGDGLLDQLQLEVNSHC